MLKLVYSFFLGLLLAVFVGMGVATFYPAPEPPVYPDQTSIIDEKDEAAREKEQSDYQKDYESFATRSENYNRNVSLIVLGAAIVCMVLGVLFEKRIPVIADGLLLGGTFSLLYSIGRSFATEDPKYSFMAVSVGLAATIIVGYIKFIKPDAGTKPVQKS